MGRRREPVAVIEAKGRKHMGEAEKAERRASEVALPDVPFRNPGTLSAAQEAEFFEIAAYLEELNSVNKSRGGGNVYSGIDSEAVAQYIIAKDMAHALQKAAESSARPGSDVDPKRAMACYRDACNLCRSYAADLGLTVTSRMKIVLPGKEGGDEFGGF